MVGVAFICCTFVAKIKCHQSNKSLLNLSKTNYNTYFITQFIRFNSKGNISISRGDPNHEVLSAHKYTLLT